MLTIQPDPTIVLDTGDSDRVYAVAFQPDGMHILGGGEKGIRRWRLADGQEVGRQTGMRLFAIAVSKDHQWIVCGSMRGASVWDAEIQDKVINVEGGNPVITVDISADSTRFATGTAKEASIWSISSGEKLVGPLEHVNDVTGVRFSPDGERIATACQENSVRVFDSRTGDEHITINTITPRSIFWAITPLSWSNDGQQRFAASKDNKTKCFDVSTGSQLAETQVLRDGDVGSIALATNGKFCATFGDYAITFLETASLSQIPPVVEESESIESISLSLDSRYLATGRRDGKISVRDLGHILPNSYDPFHVSIWPVFCLPH